MGLGERLGLLDTRAQGSSAPEFKGLTQTFSNRAGPAGGAGGAGGGSELPFAVQVSSSWLGVHFSSSLQRTDHCSLRSSWSLLHNSWSCLRSS